jgi:choline dehydrogenase-like flavoprotein
MSWDLASSTTQLGLLARSNSRKNSLKPLKRLSLDDRGEYLCRYPVRLKSPCGRYTGCAYFRPATTMTNSLPLYKYKSSLGAGAGLSRVKKMFSPKLFHPDILAEIASHLFHVNIPGRTFNILFVGEQKRGTNRVFWEGDRLTVDWSISEDEIAIYRGMLRQLEEMLKDLADEMNIKTDITEDWLWSMAHHSGTVSLGDTDDYLVDRDLKLRCCDNVFVCDGSVIQEHSYANTGLTIGQLALRLAERLKTFYS